VQPAVFTHAAWDLALATEALSYVDPDVAYALSQIYRAQDRVDGLTSGVTQAMYFAPPALPKNEEAFFGAILLYYGDMVLFEPALVKMYDELVPKIDKAFGDGKTSR
jgi:hypothetical protein